jgi:hypothetical protein
MSILKCNLVLALLLGVGCGDGPSTSGTVVIPPLGWGPASTPIFSEKNTTAAGVWFVCDNATCSTYERFGFLLRGDGTWSALVTYSGTSESDIYYCQSQDQGGTYSVEGSRLILRANSGQSVTAILEASLDRARIVVEGMTLIMRKVTAKSTGFCNEL